MRLVKALLASVLLWAGASQAALVEGKDYQNVAQPQAVDGSKGVEVAEFFWYGCPHCYHLEPKINAWKAQLPKNVVFKRVPVLWSPGHEKHAKIYYTLEALKLTDRLHGRVFDAVQGQGAAGRVELRDDDKLAAWATQHGVNKGQFMAAYKSFGVVSQVQRARQLGSAYQINGVPTFIVQGKYMTSPSLVGNEDRVFQVLNELIAREMPKGSKPAASVQPATKAPLKK